MTYGDLDTFAFNLCNNNELLNINLGVPYQKAPVSEKSKDRQFSNLCDKEIDNNLLKPAVKIIQLMNSKH